MSVYVSNLITQALDEIGDVNARRTSRSDMLRYYNRAQRVIAVRTECLETDAYFPIEANEPRYAYPENAVRMRGLRLATTTTPTNLSDYRWAREAFREDFRAQTDGWRNEGDYLYAYYARNNWIELLTTPTTSVDDGGILTYWKIPATVVSEQQSLTMELPDFAEDHQIEGMKILARMTGRERAAAQSDWNRWMLEADDLKTKFQDRSDDRRSSIRAHGQNNPFQGMR